MHGLGTQRVEEELHERFPGARILRMDLDTTTRKDAHRKILDRFGQAKADILIGTQMIAKGLDFKKVTLVGVVNADTGLLMPDFRASERTFQLLTQVAGRAGRSELRGEVILQTRNPKHEVIRFAYNHDYLGFIESELPARKQFGYPPFGRLIGIAFRGPEPDVVNDLAERWTRKAEQALGTHVRVMGPEPAFIKRIKRYYRYHTIIKVPHSSDYAEIKRIIQSVNNQFGTLPRDCYLAVDVDPVGLF
jgi:primosomal protein N' (replication factor Y)